MTVTVRLPQKAFMKTTNGFEWFAINKYFKKFEFSYIDLSKIVTVCYNDDINLKGDKYLFLTPTHVRGLDYLCIMYAENRSAS